MSMCVLVIPFLFGLHDVPVMVPECPRVMPNTYYYTRTSRTSGKFQLRGYVIFHGRKRQDGTRREFSVKVYDGEAYLVNPI